MISGLLASEISAALKEFIVTGYETEIEPFKGELRMLVEDQQGGYALIKRLFPVMRQYEGETFYYQNGRIVFTNSKGLSGVGLPHKSCQKEVTEEGTVTKTFMDDTLPLAEGSPAARWNAQWNIKRLSSGRIGSRTTGWLGKYF